MLSNKEEIMSQLPQANLHDMLCHAHCAEHVLHPKVDAQYDKVAMVVARVKSKLTTLTLATTNVPWRHYT